MTKFILKSFLFASLLNMNLSADITVTGVGEQEVNPNLASFSANIETKAKTAKETANQNAQQTDKTVKLLKSLLTNSKAVTTQGYSIYPEYKYNRKTGNSEFIGFKASNTILVKTDKIKTVGELLDKTITSGITNINNLSFSYDNPEQIYQQALEKAVANAKQRAEVLARASEIKIKKIKDIEVVNFESSPPPGPIMARMTVAESNVSTPIEAPDVKAKAIVEVVFESN